MPRYFFNHRSKDGVRDVDIDGIKLASLNTAIEEAAFAAHAAAGLADEPTSGVFELEDEGRVVVARVPYSVAAEDMPDDLETTSS